MQNIATVFACLGCVGVWGAWDCTNYEQVVPPAYRSPFISGRRQKMRLCCTNWVERSSYVDYPDIPYRNSLWHTAHCCDRGSDYCVEERCDTEWQCIYNPPSMLVAKYSYIHLAPGCVSGFNIAIYPGKTVQECAGICDADPRCKAFEYGVAHRGSNKKYKPGDCVPNSRSDSDSEQGCSGKKHNLDLYVKTHYKYFSQACVNRANIFIYHGKTVQQCAAKCDAVPECKAFEYGVAHGGSSTAYKPADCILNSRSDSSTCNGKLYNLDLFVKDLSMQLSTVTAEAATPVASQAFINTSIGLGELSSQYAMDCAGNGCHGLATSILTASPAHNQVTFPMYLMAAVFSAMMGLVVVIVSLRMIRNSSQEGYSELLA